MRLRWRRNVKTKGNGLAAAIAEREESERRLESVREHVVRPLNDRDRHNQFAEIVRRSLERGARP